jgi:hypothetical protein
MRADDQDTDGFQGKALHQKLSFLGPEFLPWLYFNINQVGGEFLISKILPKWPVREQTVKIGIGKRMNLKPLIVTETRISIVGTALDDSGEVLQAIRAGAYVDSLSLDFVIGERVHHVIVQAADGAISNAKTDQSFTVSSDGEDGENLSKQESSAETILLRMSNLDEIEDLLDGLFVQFLNRRLANVFIEQDVFSMRKIVADGLVAKLPKIAKVENVQLTVDKEAVI